MNLIDRYIQHVGKHLPEKSREDLKREIRSLVEDSLEDRSRELGRKVDTAMTVDVLKEFGRPEKMAASYTPERYLISPRLYPIFWLVVRIVMTVLFAIMLVKLFIGITQVDANFVQLIIQTVTGFASGAISALGNIVIVFAVIQYFAPDLSKELDKDDDWDPLKMEKIEDEDQVSRVEQAFGITFSVIGLAVFNFFPELLGFGATSNGEWIFLPALSEAFFTYLPWINLLWGAEIILSLFLLIQGQWQTATRWVSIAIKIMTVGLAGFMLAGPSLVGLNLQDMVASGIGFTLETATRLVSLFKQVVTVTLALIIVLDGFSIVKRIYKFAVKRSGS
ncbi:MAG: hypothetical protein L6461_22570 [Anaerolineae bacterium]|nr:hypothetical protein [Anaerolineae bacterium]